MNIYLSRSNKNKTSDKYIKGYSKRIFWDFYKKWLWFPSIFPPPPPNKELFLEEHEAQDEAASGWHTSLSGTFFFFSRSVWGSERQQTCLFSHSGVSKVMRTTKSWRSCLLLYMWENNHPHAGTLWAENTWWEWQNTFSLGKTCRNLHKEFDFQQEHYVKWIRWSVASQHSLFG